MIRYPSPLHPGATIAVTAPSSGVSANWRPQLERMLQQLRAQGYKIIEGQCLYNYRKAVSAPAKERASEFMHFLCNEDVDAIFPPCGGDLAIELLPLLDFDMLAQLPPKWVLGFSDISTLLLPLTVLSGWATAHGDHLYERSSDSYAALDTSIENVLRTKAGVTVEQTSSKRYQSIDYSTLPPRTPVWTETQWKVLGENDNKEIRMKGRLIGGCLDRIGRLAGTKYGNIPKFILDSGSDGVILHLENAGMWPTEFARTLTALRMHGWFDSITSLIFGRSSGADTDQSDAFSYVDALKIGLDGIKCPVLYDVDIGHQPPQLILIQGALTEVCFGDNTGRILQIFI